MDHGPDPSRDLVVAVAEAEALSGDVARDRARAAIRRRADGLEHGPQADVRLRVVGGPDEADDLVAGAEQAGQDRHAEEAGGAGQQDRARWGGGHGGSGS